jgi:hypothetical protein
MFPTNSRSFQQCPSRPSSFLISPADFTRFCELELGQKQLEAALKAFRKCKPSGISDTED